MSPSGGQSRLATPETPEERQELGITDSLVRFCCRIEDPDDLIADLEQALRHI